jgi:hypothetical protein
MPGNVEKRVDKLVGRLPSIFDRMQQELNLKNSIPSAFDGENTFISGARSEREVIRKLAQQKAGRDRRGF